MSMRKIRTSSWILASGLVIVVITLAGGLVAPASTLARSKPEKPSVKGFSASPTAVSPGDGEVVLSGTVSAAETCELTAKPAVPGLPAVFACISGKISDTVFLPVNETRKAAQYKFRLLVHAGTGQAKSPIVAVNAAPSAGTPLLLNATSLTAGGGEGQDYCARLKDGHLVCWGHDSWGQLGNGSITSFSSPVYVVGVGGKGLLSGVTSVASEYDVNCAALASGEAVCWGAYQAGELGNGSDEDSSTDVPVQVSGVGGEGHLKEVAQVYDTDGGFCALLMKGEVACWGGEAYGSVPQRELTPGIRGTDVPLTDVTQLSTGPNLDWVCALTASGGVYCWGANDWGQLGSGFESASRVALPVAGLTEAKSIAMNGNWPSTCAALTTGGVDCWGAAPYLGAGTDLPPCWIDADYSCSLVAVPVLSLGGSEELGGVAEVYPSDGGYCATLLAEGKLECWGENSLGSLGDGEMEPTVAYTAVPVVGAGNTGKLTGVQELIGNWANCARLSDGGVDCWGSNQDGSLGNGTSSSGYDPEGIPYPVTVQGIHGGGALGGVTDLASGYGDCAVIADGAVDCWGLEVEAEDGYGIVFATSTPEEVSAPLLTG